jgi:hypothetical protein
MKRRRLWLGVAGLALWAWCARGGGARDCPLPQYWMAPPPFYDYLQRVDLGEDGRGELLFGYSQAMRTEVEIEWRAGRGGRLEIKPLRGSRSRPYAVPYTVQQGDFAVRIPGPGGDEVVHFRCHLHFERNPFPPDVESDRHLDYYACPPAR